MARFCVGVVAGIVITTLAGAALQLHAASEGGTTDETAAAEPVEGIWEKLADCESSGHWAANTGNSYYGGLQEDLVFWRRHGGLQYASRPDLASRAAQIAVAQQGLSVQGWIAWPACSRALGLR